MNGRDKYQTAFATFKKENARKLEMFMQTLEEIFSGTPGMHVTQMSKMIVEYYKTPKYIKVWTNEEELKRDSDEESKGESDDEQDSEEEFEDSKDGEDIEEGDYENSYYDTPRILFFSYADSSTEPNTVYINKLQTCLINQDTILFDGDRVFDKSYKYDSCDGWMNCFIICNGVPQDFYRELSPDNDYAVVPPQISYPQFSLGQLQEMIPHANYPVIWLDLTEQIKETLLSNLAYHLINFDECMYRYLLTHIEIGEERVYLTFDKITHPYYVERRDYDEEQAEMCKTASYKCIKEMDKLAIIELSEYSRDMTDSYERLNQSDSPFKYVYIIEGGAKKDKNEKYLPYVCYYMKANSKAFYEPIMSQPY